MFVTLWLWFFYFIFGWLWIEFKYVIVFGTWESTLKRYFFLHLLSVRVQKKLLKISSFKHNQFCIFYICKVLCLCLYDMSFFFFFFINCLVLLRGFSTPYITQMYSNFVPGKALFEYRNTESTVVSTVACWLATWLDDCFWNFSFVL